MITEVNTGQAPASQPSVHASKPAILGNSVKVAVARELQSDSLSLHNPQDYEYIYLYHLPDIGK